MSADFTENEVGLGQSVIGGTLKYKDFIGGAKYRNTLR
jgi:hypothetical protein